MQRFTRQETEDGPDPSTKWGPDHTIADTVDLDNEDNVPIPLAGAGAAPGKTHARGSMRDRNSLRGK